ncbi:MAG TPA: efflux RND transporter permease subunit, partial [Gemmata sp.]|nr:efflux RND transporter permease subunit [Gemmata sp.]
WENPVLHWCRPLYGEALRGLLAARWLVVGGVAIAIGLVGIRIAPNLGFEFLPYMDEGVIWVRANFPEGTALEQTSDYGRRFREIAHEFEDVKFAIVQAGRNDDGTDPFPPSRVEMMIGPKPREHWKQFRTKHELLAALGKRYREEFPTTRFNFTQPIIDSVTEDTNGTSANLAVEFSGPDSGKLLELARRTVDLLRTVPGAQDVNIEQEGPQPQLVIRPDRRLCARYNVRIEDVARLVNTAIGGDPIGTQYQGERRFDIVARLDPRTKQSVAAIGRLPVYTADGQSVPLIQVAELEVVDGQTLIAREGGRRRLTVRCDIVGRDQGGFVREAQDRFDEEIGPSVPPGYKVGWLGMFENLQRAKERFLYVIPITIGVIFGLLLLMFGSFRAALVLLLSLPFASIGGVLALWIRGMNLNVSTGVGFAALFGVSIMNGVLMVRAIMALRQEGLEFRAAILQGAQDCLRPILLASVVAILGLLPASLATGLGSDVQRPLATVIVWGLLSSAALTLFLVPVFYYLLAPPLPQGRPTVGAGMLSQFVEPLPDVAAGEVVSLLGFLDSRGGEAEVFEIAGRTSREFTQVLAVVKAAEMLELVETPGHMVVLTARGKAFVAATAGERTRIWREQLLRLGLFREVYEALQRQPTRSIDRDFVLETIVTRMPHENYERIFNVFIRWAGFGELFAYDEARQQVSLRTP